jgi:3-hydroxyacyl-CoA dehydrogenase/3-hydroxy-2-methylbutyryl-CoA dehydrogenase
MEIKDVIALVSGGASGLGEAACRRLLELGARGAVALDVNEERGKKLAAELGDRFFFINTDVTDVESVQRAVDAAKAKFGTINVVVAAAGITLPSKLVTKNGPIAMEKFDKVIKVNLYGTLHLIRSAVMPMIQNRPNDEGERGVIINVSSGAAYEGQVGQVAYSASKAALVGLTMPLMRELAVHGIRVVTVAPGGFETPIYETVPQAVKDGLVSQLLFPKRLGKTSEFAMFVEELIRNPVHNGRSYRFDSGNILAP